MLHSGTSQREKWYDVEQSSSSKRALDEMGVSQLEETWRLLSSLICPQRHITNKLHIPASQSERHGPQTLQHLLLTYLFATNFNCRGDQKVHKPRYLSLIAELEGFLWSRIQQGPDLNASNNTLNSIIPSYISIAHSQVPSVSALF